MVNEVVVYKCAVCGFSSANRMALMAHLRRHKGEFERLDVRLPKSLVRSFKDLCRKHNTTTCHVLMTLLKAWIKGEELGVVSLSSPNPVIINIHETFLGKPRSSWKMPLTRAVHEVTLPCEACGSPVSFIHVSRGPLGLPCYMGLCQEHHLEGLKTGISRAYIELRDVSVRKV